MPPLPPRPSHPHTPTPPPPTEIAQDTLNGVNEIKDDLKRVNQTLTEIESKIDKLSCATSIKLLSEPRAWIKARWGTYNGTLLPLMQTYATRLGTPPPSSFADRVDEWAKQVIDGGEDRINTIAAILMGDTPLLADFSLIAECGRAFADEVRKDKPFAADDRVLWNRLTQLTALLTTDVANVNTMLSEAYSWRATKAYRAALDKHASTVCGGNLTACPTFGTADMPLALGELCSLAVANDSAALPSSAATWDCRESDRVNDLTRNYIITGLELMGAPLSRGGDSGVGERLVLGTDVLVSATDRASRDIFNLPTMWLVPASPGAFDSACTLPNATAEAGCSLVGDHADTTNTAWAHLHYPLGYHASLWEASPDPWLIMRYAANATAVDGATGDAASLVSRMEGATTLGLTGQSAFSNISDRFWWLPNTSFSATLRDFGLRRPGDHDVMPAHGFSTERYFIDPDHMSVDTRCFVAAAANATTAGLPTGIVCHSGDMAGVFDGPCIYHRWDGASTFDFVHADESHDYTVTCPIAPRAWFVASKLGSRPAQAGPGPWPPATPLTVVCPALNKYFDDKGSAGEDGEYGRDETDPQKGVSNRATCGLSVHKTYGAFRDSNTCTGETDPSILYCHHAWTYRLDIYKKRTCSTETQLGPGGKGQIIAVTPQADSCIRDPDAASNAAAHRLAYPIFNLSSPGTTLPLSPELQAAPPPPHLFRLPALNIHTLPSIASPFTGKDFCDETRLTRFGSPRRCGPGATEFIVDAVGANGAADHATFPMRDVVNNTATRAVLRFTPGSDNVTCTPVRNTTRKEGRTALAMRGGGGEERGSSPPPGPTSSPSVFHPSHSQVWVRADGTMPPPGTVVTTGMLFTVAAGPVLSADADKDFVSTVVESRAGRGRLTTTLSIEATLGNPPNSTAAVLPRVVQCLVTGRVAGSDTGLPVYASAAAYALPTGRLMTPPSAAWTNQGGVTLVNAKAASMAVSGGGYADLNNDAANCGACGAECPAGAACWLGVCGCERVVTSMLQLSSLPAAVNATVIVIGGGGGASGAPSNVARGDYNVTGGGGGGGGSSVVLINGTVVAGASGGRGGRTAFDAEARAGGAGDRFVGSLQLPAGASVEVYVGGGGGGGAAAGGFGDVDGPGVQAGGGGGGAGYFGGGGGGGSARGNLFNPNNLFNPLFYPAYGATVTGPGAGGDPQSLYFPAGAGIAGALHAGGAGGLGNSPATYRQPTPVPPPSTRAGGGTVGAGGAGVAGLYYVAGKRSPFPLYTGGSGGGGALGGGGGAGTRGTSPAAAEIAGGAGGGPGLPGAGKGAGAGASVWGGVDAAAGRGGTAAADGGGAGGGAAGQVVLWHMPDTTLGCFLN